MSEVHFCRGPKMVEVHREEIGTRWCFGCRAHRPFVYVVMAPEGPSYYGPNPSIRCDLREHVDGDLFPGREREWEC